MNTLIVTLVIVVAPLAVLWYLGRWAIRVCERANRADWGGKWLNRLDGLNRLLCQKYHRLTADPVPLPAEGGALVVSNHVSGLDPMLIFTACRRPLRFLIAQEEYDRWWLRWLFKQVRVIPLERSKDPRKPLYAARQALEAGEVVAVFPQGAIQPDSKSIRLKRGVLLLAVMSRVPIYPLRVEGIRGQGETVKAVFIRSRARIHAFPPFYCGPSDTKKQLKRLQGYLSAKD